MKELNESVIKAVKKELKRQAAVLDEAQKIIERMPAKRKKRGKKKAAAKK